ncbi:MAG: DNA translocase FtsK 4TM domain-containing protein, partial [Porticoccaceae bacterium]|nr:DNA translocase FtsK 4TM domain-containing protein [Porticoccaceae bacterium]
MILREGALIGWLVVCIYLLIALFSFSPDDPGFSHTGSRDLVNNAAGPTGAWLADVLFWLFGIMAYMFPLLLMWRAWRVFRSKRDDQQPPFDWLTFVQRCLGLVLVMLSATALTDLHYGSFASSLPEGLGGVMGAGVAQVAVSAFSVIGSTLVLLAVALFGLTIFADISWLALIDG